MSDAQAVIVGILGGIVVVALLYVFVVLPEVSSNPYKENFNPEEFAFESEVKSIKAFTPYLANQTLVINWYSNNTRLGEEYWYKNCIEGCEKGLSGGRWVTDLTKPVIIVKRGTDSLGFTLTIPKNYFLDYSHMKMLNPTITNVDYKIIDKFGQYYFSINGTSLEEQYMHYEGDILPRVIIYAPIISSDDLDQACKQKYIIDAWGNKQTDGWDCTNLQKNKSLDEFTKKHSINSVNEDQK